MQAYREGMTQEQGYVWFLPGWYRENWYDIDRLRHIRSACWPPWALFCNPGYRGPEDIHFLLKNTLECSKKLSTKSVQYQAAGWDSNLWRRVSGLAWSANIKLYAYVPSVRMISNFSRFILRRWGNSVLSIDSQKHYLSCWYIYINNVDMVITKKLSTL